MRARIFIALALLCLAAPLFAQEKFTATMQFNGAKGEAISAFSWGVSNPTSTTGGGAGQGKATFSDFNFTKPVTQLSTTLFQGCETGKKFPTVVVTVADKRGGKYYEIRLTNVLVSSYQLSGGGGESTESVSLSYASIEYILIGL